MTSCETIVEKDIADRFLANGWISVYGKFPNILTRTHSICSVDSILLAFIGQFVILLDDSWRH